MITEIKKIVDAIKLNVEVAKIDDKPVILEISMDKKSKNHIAQLIEEYAKFYYQSQSLSWKFCPHCGIKWEHDSNSFGCWSCGFTN